MSIPALHGKSVIRHCDWAARGRGWSMLTQLKSCKGGQSLIFCCLFFPSLIFFAFFFTLFLVLFLFSCFCLHFYLSSFLSVLLYLILLFSAFCFLLSSFSRTFLLLVYTFVLYYFPSLLIQYTQAWYYWLRHSCLSLRLSACNNSRKLSGFSWNMTFGSFDKNLFTSQFWLKSGDNNGYFTKNLNRFARGRDFVGNPQVVSIIVGVLVSYSAV
jgi:hypothetical protein